MTCCHRLHNESGQPRCTKGITIFGDGGEEGAMRRLMYWAFLGIDAANKPAHKDLWEQVEIDWAAGRVPEIAELDDGRMPMISP